MITVNFYKREPIRVNFHIDTPVVVAGGGGVTYHGALTGLNDDDHPQYFNQARGDARYSQLGHGHTPAQVGLGNVNNTSDSDKPVSTAQAAAIAAKENIGVAASLLTSHEAAADPHPQYTTKPESIINSIIFG